MSSPKPPARRGRKPHKDQLTAEDDALLAALGVDLTPRQEAEHTPRQLRALAGFEEIQRFVQQHGRPPSVDAEDVFEQIQATRLRSLRRKPDCVQLLAPLDAQGLLAPDPEADAQDAREAVAAMDINTLDDMDDDALLAALGITPETAPALAALTQLRHVRSAAQIRAAEEVARRDPCPDFDEIYKPLFDQVQADLQTGLRHTRRFANNARISRGDWFIVDGLIAYVAEMGAPIKAPNGEPDARLRVIYSNGTQSNLLMRSLKRALNKDEAGRRILADDGQARLELEEGDTQSGTIYVLRSLCDHPFVAQHRELIHKIGVTGGSVQKRIAGAAQDPTYLLADVQVVATYELANINRTRLEALLHRLFASAQIDLTLQDRFGRPVKPREWFLLPLAVIDQAVQAIRDGRITRLRYDPQSASLTPTQGASR